jgi:hypothetical protein
MSTGTWGCECGEEIDLDGLSSSGPPEFEVEPSLVDGRPVLYVRVEFVATHRCPSLAP